MTNTITLSEFGNVLTSRTVASQVRSSVVMGEKNIIDFTGIDLVTHSFCDEIFGGLFSDLGTEGFKNTLGFKNVSDTNLAIIKGTLASKKSSVTTT